MNSDTYQDILNYLNGSTTWNGLTESDKRKLEQTASNYFTEGNILYRRRKEGKLLVVPEEKKEQVLEAIHNHPLAGHFGQQGTYNRISRQYYWPGMYNDVREHVKTCHNCQIRSRRVNQREPLEPVPISGAFAHIAIDVIGPLPVTTTNNKYIVLAIDYLTKWPEGKAIETADSLTIATFIYEDIICRHGIPEEITTDLGTEFVNEFHTLLYQHYRIKHITTTAYHPQANGLVERENQTIKNALAKQLSKENNDWDKFLPSALFAIRTVQQSTTKQTPFELTYGRTAREPVDQILQRRKKEQRADYDLDHRIKYEISRIKDLRNQARDSITKAQSRQKAYYDAKASDNEPIGIGDQVLLYRDSLETSWSGKLEPKWEGPFYVHDKKGTTFTLRNLDGVIRRYPVHRNRLKKYYKPKSSRANSPP